MLSVVLATHNGEPTLPRVLDAFARLHAPRGGWRLIVVDNASTDGTGALLAERQRRGDLPLAVLREPRPGKNRALNAALAHAEGDLAVLTDDDVLPEPDWLVRMREAADDHPEFAIFGGAVRPDFPAPPPPWLDPADISFGVLYGATEHGAGPCPADLVWGPNMALRSAILRRGLRFDPNVGPGVGARYPMGSETEFTVRLERHGYRAWFVADALVHHIVRPHQMTEAYIAGRAYRHGFGIVNYQPGLLASRWPRVFGLPLRTLPVVGCWLGLAGLGRLLPPSRLRLRAIYQGAWWRGVLGAIARRADAAPAAAVLPERSGSV